MILELITPDKKIFSGEILLVQVPGEKGNFEILKNHAPIISSLGKGIIRIVCTDHKELTYSIDSGVVESKKNITVILTEKVT
ncbi:MAG: F0F1 ATP synthase subunit epsilon [Prolixibacteraceae bacterium]|nr:F0F1 ATP synthase subunit epsilon [Prolixibacteraceae bacterium]